VAIAYWPTGAPAVQEPGCQAAKFSDLGTKPQQRRGATASSSSVLPTCHWPDTNLLFDPAKRASFTPADAFGLHYCSDAVFLMSTPVIAPDFALYYDCLMGPERPQRGLAGLKRMDALPEVSLIATGHGPLLAITSTSGIGDYRDWRARSAATKPIGVCYLSQYGFCDRSAKAWPAASARPTARPQLVDPALQPTPG